MTTATPTRPTRALRGEDVLLPNRRQPPRRSSWAGKAIVIALFAAVTAGIFAFVGMFGSSRSDINIDPVKSESSVAQTTVAAPRPADAKVVVDYLAKMKAWNECVKKHPVDGATKSCGSRPVQVDDPNLNAYLADLLNWNKCAAPLLKHSALAQAEAACGPQPVPTTDK